MKRKTLIYSLFILLAIGYSHHFTLNGYSGSLFAQTDNSTTSQKNIKKEKKKRMRESANADRMASKRHMDIQTKATRKRMKKHLKQTKKNVQNSHR